VQRYKNADAYTEWAYEVELIKFFDEGMSDDSFIDAVSRIFSHGCHIAGCSNLDVRMADKRKSNFFLIINDIFGIDVIKLPTKPPTRRPTPAPIPLPVNPTQPTSIFVTAGPTPRPTNPPIAPRPTPPPMNTKVTPRPTSRPSTKPIPIDQSPQAQFETPPTYPPVAPSPTLQYPAIPDATLQYPAIPNPTVQYLTRPDPTIPYPAGPGPAVPYPTVQYPTTAMEQRPIFATFRPIGNIPIGQPHGNADSNGQTVQSPYPTYVETEIIVLEPNGAEPSALFWCSCAISLFVTCATHLVLAAV